MTSWKTYRLGDIAKFQTGKLNSNAAVENGKYPFFTCSPNTLAIDNYAFDKEAILLAGNNAEGNFSIKYYKGKFNAYQRTYIIETYNDKCDIKFLFYALKLCLQQFKLMSQGTSTKFLTAVILNNFEISLPGLEEQRRIAGILGAIDDKIENNRRINTNLELQAQALYKQWFVDNRKDDWEEKPLSEIAEFVGGYSYKGNELVESSSTAMATIKNFERKGGFKVDGFKDIVASSKLKAEQHAELFDILVAHTDLTQNADVIGNAEILLTFGGYTDVIFSMDLVKVLPKSNFPYKYLLAALLKNPYFKAHCLGYVNGTTVLHMSKKALPEYVVACPLNSEAEKMDMAFKVYYHKMAEILQENETLATLRDTLLPKLMNGEIITK